MLINGYAFKDVDLQPGIVVKELDIE